MPYTTIDIPKFRGPKEVVPQLKIYPSLTQMKMLIANMVRWVPKYTVEQILLSTGKRIS